MAVQKRRTSKAKRDKRRANWKVEMPGLSTCPQCHEVKLPHHICPNCGYYKGREALKVK